MSSGRADLADVRALLSSDISVVQGQGLASLCNYLKQPFSNAKEKLSAISVLFDCFTNYGDIVAQWCLEAVPLLLKTGLLTTDEATTHCFLKLLSADVSDTSTLILVRLLLQLSNSPISTCFTLLRKSKRCSKFLIEELQNFGSEKYLPTMKALLYSGLLSQEESISLLSHISAITQPESSFCEEYAEYLQHKYSRRFLTVWKSSRCVKATLQHCTELSESEVISLLLNAKHSFAIVDVLLKRPELVMNENFPTNNVLLPSLFALYASRSELAKCIPGLVPSDHLNRIKALVAQCQSVPTWSNMRLNRETDGFLSTFDYLGCIASEDYVAQFIDVWIAQIDAVEVHERSIVFATALLPYCSAPILVSCFQLLSELVKRATGYANSLLLLFTTLYAKPYFKVDKAEILKATGSLLVNRYAITPAVNFLSIVCRRPGEERSIAFNLLGDVVTKFPTAFDAVKPLAVPTDNDPLDLLEAKLNLMTTLCVSTDRSDELLPSLSKLLKKDAATVAIAIPVVKVLCKEDILDVDTVRKQLGNKVRQPGYEKALAGYCEILATAASQKEQDEGDLVGECVKELWDITQIKRDSFEIISARKAAWCALSCFDALSVCGVVSKTPEDWMTLFAKLEDEERRGLVTFLQKLVADDLESLSRTLYTKEYTRKSSLSPFITNLHNALRRTNQEAPWFWTATLPLFSVIVSEMPQNGKGLQAIKLLRRVLREVHVADEEVTVVFAGWRICLVSLLGVLTENSDPLKARDQIVEECKRSLTSTELSINNVLITLAILAAELKRYGTLIGNPQAAAEFEVAMRPWFVGVLEFMFPIVKKDYVQKSPPVIQINVNQRCVSKNAACSAVWMTCMSMSEQSRRFFDGDLISKALKWKFGHEMDPDGHLFTVLTGGDLEEECLSLTVSKIWIFSAALGTDELITNSLSRAIPPDDGIEDAVRRFDDDINAKENDVARFFSRISNVPLATFRKYERRLRKPLERIFNKGSEELKRAAYEGLSRLASVSLLTVALDLPPDYKHLPEDSILRAVIAQFGPKSLCSFASLHDLLPVLIDHERSDGRHLPPMEWQFMLMSIDYQEDEEARLNLLKLAFQQKDVQIIYELTTSKFLTGSSSSSLSQYLLTISKQLPMILAAMPASRVRTILDHLLRFAVENDDKGTEILNNIDDSGRNQIVADTLISHLPKFDSTRDLMHKLLRLQYIDQKFNGKVSRSFDFWLGCSGRAETKLVTLVDLYVEMSKNSNVLLSIFGYCSMNLPLQQRLDKLVDLMSIGKVMISCQKPTTHLEAVLDLFLALICSTPSAIPLHWLSPDVTDLLHARWRYYWRDFMKKNEFRQLSDVIVAFLFPCFLFDDLSLPLTKAVKGMLLYILSLQPDIVRPYLEDKSVYWERLTS